MCSPRKRGLACMRGLVARQLGNLRRRHFESVVDEKPEIHSSDEIKSNKRSCYKTYRSTSPCPALPWFNLNPATYSMRLVNFELPISDVGRVILNSVEVC
jgi:hypothetical protein